MKFIKNHSITGVELPFSEMEILPLIENRKEAEEYAATIGYKVGYYSENLSFQYRVPYYLTLDKVSFLDLGKNDTYDIIELNKNEEIEIKDGICSIKKKRVLDFETVYTLFFAFFFLGIFVWDSYCDPDIWTPFHLLNSVVLFYLGITKYNKNIRLCKK